MPSREWSSAKRWSALVISAHARRVAGRRRAAAGQDRADLVLLEARASRSGFSWPRSQSLAGSPCSLVDVDLRHLADLLLERHAPEQVGDAAVDRLPRVLVGGASRRRRRGAAVRARGPRPPTEASDDRQRSKQTASCVSARRGAFDLLPQSRNPGTANSYNKGQEGRVRQKPFGVPNDRPVAPVAPRRSLAPWRATSRDR